ncbi:hypothetical protein M378DRAFT_177817 [Amanita muscaria Koide BX008]|uniref:Uncharacterized protein n=1 Tax=Amanita muscaria (strain Koide BX008) TaxID=946122 RepID=A0A0C2XAT6_AMAMK|nr:hypothetical protein M378DRAFT_177817 [Amanita muscaria Koide BX008]
MTLVPPPNTAGVIPPANPQHPLALGDIPNVNQIHADVNQLRGEMQLLQAGFARIEARQMNAGIARLNWLEMKSNTGLIEYRAKQKVVVGDGILLANALLVEGVAPLAALPVVPAVGTTIAATISPDGLTHQAILDLIQFYNLDLGIQPNEELVEIRWQRILNWLTRDV